MPSLPGDSRPKALIGVVAGMVAATLAGCVQPPLAPSVVAVAGPRKSQAEFQMDNGYCMAFARDHYNDGQIQSVQAFGTTFGGTGTAQQQYDKAFVQCMLTKGESVPGLGTPADYAEPGPSRPASDPLVRSIQSELVRTGYLSGGVDGAYGPSTRAAIISFERANGMSANGSATSTVLARLRAAPSSGGTAAPAVGSLVAPVTGQRGGGLSQPVAGPGDAPPPASPGLVAPVTGGGAPKSP